jgi:hypothetical protein
MLELEEEAKKTQKNKQGSDSDSSASESEIITLIQKKKGIILYVQYNDLSMQEVVDLKEKMDEEEEKKEE